VRVGPVRNLPEGNAMKLSSAKAPPRPPLHPKRPENVCWGCDRYCPADALACGNGTIRTPHPAELFGEDWMDWPKPPV
jgi:Protein of unknown function (DUF3079)